MARTFLAITKSNHDGLPKLHVHSSDTTLAHSSPCRIWMYKSHMLWFASNVFVFVLFFNYWNFCIPFQLDLTGSSANSCLALSCWNCRLLGSLCFLYSLLIIAGLCHSVKTCGGTISNDRMVAHFGETADIEPHSNPLKVCEQWEVYPEKRKNQSERSMTVMWLYLMNYSSSRITLSYRLIDYSWRHVRFGQNEWWLFINKALKITTGSLCVSERLGNWQNLRDSAADEHGGQCSLVLAVWKMNKNLLRFSARPILWMKGILYRAYQASPVRENYVQPFCLDCVAMITYRPIMYT